MTEIDSIRGVLDALVPDDNEVTVEDLEGNKYTAKLNFPIRTTTKCLRALDKLAKSADEGASIRAVLMSGLASEDGEASLEAMFLAMYGTKIWDKVTKKYPACESPLDIFDAGEFLNALAVGLGKQSSKISGAVLRVMEVLEAATKGLDLEKASESS